MQLWLISFATVLSLMGPAAGQVTVLAGGDSADGACSQIGEVLGLDPNGDRFLSVSNAPRLKT